MVISLKAVHIANRLTSCGASAWSMIPRLRSAQLVAPERPVGSCHELKPIRFGMIWLRTHLASLLIALWHGKVCPEEVCIYSNAFQREGQGSEQAEAEHEGAPAPVVHDRPSRDESTNGRDPTFV